MGEGDGEKIGRSSSRGKCCSKILKLLLEYRKSKRV